MRIMSYNDTDYSLIQKLSAVRKPVGTMSKSLAIWQKPRAQVLATLRQQELSSQRHQVAQCRKLLQHVINDTLLKSPNSESAIAAGQVLPALRWGITKAHDIIRTMPFVIQKTVLIKKRPCTSRTESFSFLDNKTPVRRKVSTGIL